MIRHARGDCDHHIAALPGRRGDLGRPQGRRHRGGYPLPLGMGKPLVVGPVGVMSVGAEGLGTQPVGDEQRRRHFHVVLDHHPVFGTVPAAAQLTGILEDIPSVKR